MCAYRDSKKWLLLAYIIELHTTTVTPQKSKLYVLTIARYLETQIGGLYRLSFQATVEMKNKTYYLGFLIPNTWRFLHFGRSISTCIKILFLKGIVILIVVPIIGIYP